MWPFKKTKLRRLGVRRNIKPLEPSLWQRFRDSRGGVPLLLVVLFFVGVIMLDLHPIDPLLYRKGQYVPADIYARVNFKTKPQRLLEEARSKAELTTPGVFVLDTDYLDRLAESLKSAPTVLSVPIAEDDDAGLAMAAAFDVSDDEQRQVWADLKLSGYPDYEAEIGLLMAELSRLVLVDSDAIMEQLRRNINVDVQLPDGMQRFTSGPDLVPTSAVATIERNVNAFTEEFAAPIRSSVRAFLMTELSRRPIYVVDAAAMQREVERAIAEINAFPPTKDYERGQRLVTATGTTDDGRMVGLSDADLEVLRAEHVAWVASQREGHLWGLWARVIGRSTILAAIVAMGAVYIVFYRRRVVTNPLRSLAMVVLFLGMLMLNKFMFNAGWNRYVAVLPVMIAAVILTIAYDQRFALALSSLLALLVVLQMRSSLGMMLVVSSASMTSILLLNDIRTRSKLIEITALAACVTFIMTCAMGMTMGQPWPFVLTDAVWASVFAMLVGFIVQGFLPIIERAFKIATSMTLLEWCDASKPLLRRLAMNAPGTYNHSLQLGAMCEAAAESIGANGLLARVGAYYHDIGKTNKPEYFVENDPGAAARHEKLAPEMSLLILFGHVKNGIEMAREYGLPTVLHEFIDTHHGTTVAQFFYHAATQNRRENEPGPDEMQFRYPGPKPQSKEAGILMMADASESSVRSMTDPTTKQIEAQVHRIVSGRLADGQFDECELTLTEVHRIEQSLVKSLLGFYHARIAYPKIEQPTETHHAPAPARPGAD